ncbi:MAG TPA: PAS domain S-box protein, partial [Candidatus Limnocylindria bacterium]
MFVETTLRNWPELSRRYVLTGLAVVGLLMILTSLDVAGATWIWESGHWLAASGVAFALAGHGWRRADGVERRVRGAISISIGLWLAGVVAWIIQSAAGSQAVPAVSDAIFVAAVVPAAIGFHVGLRARGDGQMWVVYLDALLFFTALATLLFSVFAPSDPAAGPQLLLTIPVAFLALAGAGLIASLEGGVLANNPGLVFLLAGCALIGTAYLAWISEAPMVPAAGTIGNYICSIGILAGGIGTAILRLPTGGRVPGRRTRAILDLVPAIAVGWTLAILVGRELTGAAGDLLVMAAAFSVIAVSAVRQAWLVRQRGVLVARERELTEAAVGALERLTDAEERYRSLVERIPAVIYLDEADPARPGRSRLVFISPQIERILGIGPDEFIRDPELWYELIHPDDREAVVAAEMRHFADGTPLVREFRMRRRDGSIVWVRDQASLVRGNGSGRGSHGVVLDVTAEKTFEEALRTSEEQVRSIIETASSAFVGMDGAGVIMDWNARAEETFGWRRDEAIGKRVGELIVPEATRAQHEAGFRRVQRGGRPRTRGRRELVAMHRDGREFPVEIAMWAIEQGGSYRFSALIDDITERKRLEEELRRQAFEDSLTGLANRALFIDRVGHALRRQRDSKRAAILVADLDDFSHVNEAMGHAAGDDLLVQVAGRLSAALRPADTVARMGGDEFAILLEEVDGGLAERVA